MEKSKSLSKNHNTKNKNKKVIYLKVVSIMNVKTIKKI